MALRLVKKHKTNIKRSWRLVLKKKVEKDPSKLLKKKTDVVIDDQKIAVGPGGEKTTIKVKDFKAKQPQVSKETITEFLESFRTNTIPKKILADFNIDKITKNEDIFQMINGIAKGFKPDDVVKQTRGKLNKVLQKLVEQLSKDEDFLVEVLNKAWQNL